MGNSKRNLRTHTHRQTDARSVLYALYVVLLIYILVVSLTSSRSSKLLSFRLKCRHLAGWQLIIRTGAVCPAYPPHPSHLTVCGNSSLVSLIATESPNATIRQIRIRIRKQFSRRQNRATLPFRCAFHTVFRIRIVRLINSEIYFRFLANLRYKQFSFLIANVYVLHCLFHALRLTILMLALDPINNQRQQQQQLKQ